MKNALGGQVTGAAASGNPQNVRLPAIALIVFGVPILTPRMMMMSVKSARKWSRKHVINSSLTKLRYIKIPLKITFDNC